MGESRSSPETAGSGLPTPYGRPSTSCAMGCRPHGIGRPLTRKSMRSEWSLGLLVVLLLPAFGNGKKDSKQRVSMWLQWMTIVPMIFNIVSLCFILLAIHHIREMKNQREAIISSTRLLARCAVRLKVGPIAKKSILEYAKTRPELSKLLQEDAMHGSLEQFV